MSALARLCLLFLCLQSSAAEAELTAPRDLAMLTLNTNYTLTWHWEQSSAASDSATFTVQYTGHHNIKKKKPPWKTACEETSGRSCDLTGLPLMYLGIYVLRVRANLDGRHSEWASRQFCPDKEAAIGPPTQVRLAVDGSALDVVFTEPQNSSNSSMKEVIPSLSFQIRYWEQPEGGKGLKVEMLSSKVNMVTLSNLTPWSRYCVQVQSIYEFYNKSSSFTPPLCSQTEGVTPWWKIFLYFFISLLIMFLVMLLFLYGGHRCFQFWKATLFPGEKLPSHFNQREADYPRLIVSDSDLDLCDPVIVCPAPPVLEVNVDPAMDSAAPPAGLDQDSSGRHSRQNSSSSGDSGVYSAGGNSGAGPPSFPDPRRRLDSEELKLLSVKSEFNVPPATADDGVADVEV